MPLRNLFAGEVAHPHSSKQGQDVLIRDRPHIADRAGLPSSYRARREEVRQYLRDARVVPKQGQGRGGRRGVEWRKISHSSSGDKGDVTRIAQRLAGGPSGVFSE